MRGSAKEPGECQQAWAECRCMETHRIAHAWGHCYLQIPPTNPRSTTMCWCACYSPGCNGAMSPGPLAHSSWFLTKCIVVTLQMAPAPLMPPVPSLQPGPSLPPLNPQSAALPFASPTAGAGGDGAWVWVGAAGLGWRPPEQARGGRGKASSRQEISCFRSCGCPCRGRRRLPSCVMLLGDRVLPMISNCALESCSWRKGVKEASSRAEGIHVMIKNGWLHLFWL